MNDLSMINQAPASAESTDSGQVCMSPGVQLAAFRAERGWTIEQVASQLNLAPRQVAALEADDYPALPGMPIVRGFVRAYAKLLKVDAGPLLVAFGGETVLVNESIRHRKDLSTPFSDNRLPSMAARSGFSSKWIIGALLFALAAAGIWSSRQGGLEIVLNASKDVKASLVSMANALSVPSIPSVNNVEKVDAAPPLPVRPVVNAEPDSAIASINEATLAASVVDEAVAAPVVPTNRDILSLKMREDSWIEIRRADGGEVLIARLAKAGESEDFELKGAISLVVGNAAGVDLTLRGDAIELKASSKSNVARLNLE